MSTTDPVDIHNWRRLDDRLTTSGQPDEEQLGRIRALGVGHIVNLGLHSHEKALPDEAASVAARAASSGGTVPPPASVAAGPAAEAAASRWKTLRRTARRRGTMPWAR